MKTKTILCIFLLCTFSCAIFAQGKKLSIKDAIRISNMKSMDEAADLLTSYGYSRAKQEAQFYSDDVVSHWYKDCEIYSGGINCFNTFDVKKKSASAVSILANGRNDVVIFYVYNKEEKDNCLKQMKSLGFKPTKIKREYDENEIEYYVNATDTIYFGEYKEASKHIFFDSFGHSDTISIEEDHIDTLLCHIKPNLEKEGYQLTKKDKNGFEFKNGDAYVKLVKADDVWDGTVYEFVVCRTRDWSDDGNGGELYGPNGEKGSFSGSHWDEELIRERMDLDDDSPIVVDKFWCNAAFPGSDEDRSGEKGLNKWIQENLKYPQEAERKNIEGTVDVRFNIEWDGSISNVRIANGVHPLLDNEALKIKNMRKWRPARGTGGSISEDRTISIEFKKGKRPSLKEYETYISAAPNYRNYIKMIQDNLRYPEDAKMSKTEGTVEVGFIVKKDGTFDEVKIIKGVCKSIDEETLRILKSGPGYEWNPAIAHGQPIDEYHTIKIDFKLPK